MRVRGIRVAAGRPSRALALLGVLGLAGITGTACAPGATTESVRAGRPNSPATTGLNRRPTSTPPRTPSFFAAFESFHLEIRSATTGHLIRTLRSGGNVISPDLSGRYVYYVAQRGPNPWPIERVAVAGGTPVKIASGWDPVISPNGEQLAYVPANQDDTLVIENLATRSSHRMDLGALIGSDATLGVLTWLGDNRLVAIPPADAIPAGAGPSMPTAAPGKRTTCTSLITNKRQCVIVVDKPGTAPRAHIEVLPRSIEGDDIISTVGPGPRTLLLGALGTVSRLTIGAAGISLEHTYAVPGHESLAFGFSPNGRELLYLRNHGPVQLWTGTIGRTTIRPLRELQPNVDFGSVAW